ncbi:MAG TPA: hypothetical protein VMW75_28250 [Thermoanaerobaculia bacterium]|nr:hypothetical protein [Thermoanaerobaculia bacterium]
MNLRLAAAPGSQSTNLSLFKTSPSVVQTGSARPKARRDTW